MHENIQLPAAASMADRDLQHLVLSIEADERIFIGNTVVELVEFGRSRAKLRIGAPADVPIMREALAKRIAADREARTDRAILAEHLVPPPAKSVA